MGTTYVYLTTNVDASVDLALSLLGPRDLTGAKLSVSSVGKSEKQKLIMEVPRSIDPDMYVLETSLSIASTYIASLQLMIRGHGFLIEQGVGSTLWSRWRKADVEVGYWSTDYESHDTWIDARSRKYHFIVNGQRTIGYDDVYLDLSVQ